MSVSSLFSRFLPGSASASSTSTSRSHRQLAPNTASTKAEGNTLDAALRLDRFHRAWSTLVSAAHAAANAPKGLDPPLSSVADPLVTFTQTLAADTCRSAVGPCLDYVLAHHSLATLIDTASSDQPLGFFAIALDALAYLVHTWPSKLVVAHPPIHLAIRRAVTHALANRSRLARVYPESLLALVACVAEKVASAPELVHVLVHDRRGYSQSAAVEVPASSPIPGAFTTILTSPKMKRSTSLTFTSFGTLSTSPTAASTSASGRITSPNTPARSSTRADTGSSSHRRTSSSSTNPQDLDFPLLDTLLAHIHQPTLSGALARLALTLLLTHACTPTLVAILAPSAPLAHAPFLDAIPASLCALFTSSDAESSAVEEVVRWVAHLTRSCPNTLLVDSILDRIQRGFIRGVVAPQLTVDADGDLGRLCVAAAKCERVVKAISAGPLARVMVESLLGPTGGDGGSIDGLTEKGAKADAIVAADAAHEPFGPRVTLLNDITRAFAGEPAMAGYSSDSSAEPMGGDKADFACASLLLALIEYHPTYTLPCLVPSLVPPPSVALPPLAVDPTRRPSDASSSLSVQTPPLATPAAILSTSPPAISTSYTSRLSEASSTNLSRYESIPALIDFPLAFLPPAPHTTDAAQPAMPPAQLTRLFRRLARAVQARAQVLSRAKKSPINRQPSLRNLLGGVGGGQERSRGKEIAEVVGGYLAAAELRVARVPVPARRETNKDAGDASMRSVSTYYTAKTDFGPGGAGEWSIKSAASRVGGASEASVTNAATRSSLPTLTINEDDGKRSDQDDEDDFLLPSSLIRDEPSTPGPFETLSFDQLLKSAVADSPPQATSPLEALPSAVTADVPPPVPTLPPDMGDASYSTRSWPWRRRRPPTSPTPQSLASLFVSTESPEPSLASPVSPTSPFIRDDASRPLIPSDFFLQLVVAALTQWRENSPQVNLMVTGMLTGLLCASVSEAGYHRILAHVVIEWSLYVLEGGSAEWDKHAGLDERVRRVVNEAREAKVGKDGEENERILTEWAAELASVAMVVLGRWERTAGVG